MSKIDIIKRLIITALISLTEAVELDDEHAVMDKDGIITAHYNAVDGACGNILYRMKTVVPENEDEFRAVAELITLNPNEGEEFASLSMAIKGGLDSDEGAKSSLRVELFNVSGNITTDIEERSGVYAELLKDLI